MLLMRASQWQKTIRMDSSFKWLYQNHHQELFAQMSRRTSCSRDFSCGWFRISGFYFLVTLVLQIVEHDTLPSDQRDLWPLRIDQNWLDPQKDKGKGTICREGLSSKTIKVFSHRVESLGTQANLKWDPVMFLLVPGRFCWRGIYIAKKGIILI